MHSLCFRLAVNAQPTFYSLLLVALLCSVVPLSSMAQHARPGSKRAWLPPNGAGQALDATYLYYPNRGQLTNTEGQPVPQVHYYTNHSAPAIYARTNAISLVAALTDSLAPDTLLRVDLKLTGTKAVVQPQAHLPGSGYLNYFTHTTGPTGITNLTGYQRLVWPEVYPNIDWHLASNPTWATSQLVVHPGGQPNKIQWQLTGHDSLHVLPHQLEVFLSGKQLVALQAIAWQPDARNQPLPMPWQPTFVQLGSGKVALQCGSYDTRHPLVLEFFVPVPPAPASPPATGNLIWSSYYDGSIATTWLTDVRTDELGNNYYAGYTEEVLFPTTDGVIVDTDPDTLGQPNSQDAFIIKFNKDQERLWATYFGGSGYEGACYMDIALNGNIFLTGSTASGDLPLIATDTAMYLDTNLRSTDAYVCRITDDAEELEWCTLLGDSGLQQPNDIAVDLQQRVHIIGSGAAGAMPLTQVPGGYMDTVPGNAWIARFTNQAALQWCSYLPVHHAYAIDHNNPGQVFVAGSAGYGMPLVQPDSLSFIDSLQVQQEAYVMQFGAQIPTLIWSTYLGGYGNDAANDLVVHGGQLYVGGSGNGDGFPVMDWGDTLRYDTLIPNQNNGGWAAHFGPQRNLLWCGWAGPNQQEEVWHLAADDNGLLYLSGASSPELVPAYNTATYNQAQFSTYEAYLVAFTPDKCRLWATHFGGLHQEQLNALAVYKTTLYGAINTRTTKFTYPLHSLPPPAWFKSNKYTNTYYTGGLCRFEGDNLPGLPCPPPDSVLPILPPAAVQTVWQQGAATVHLYPNPATHRLALNCKGFARPPQLALFDLAGKAVPLPPQQTTSPHFTVSLPDLPPGLYLLRVSDEQHTVAKRLVIAPR